MSRTRLAAAMVTAAVLVVTLGGCGRVKQDRMASALYSATKGYQESIRWGYFDAAIGFLAPDERGDVDMDAFNNIRVTGYDVVQPAVITPQQTAVQLVRIDYVLQDEQRLKHLADRQEWRWDEHSGVWWLHSGLPKFDG
jgi:hypothetical protein